MFDCFITNLYLKAFFKSVLVCSQHAWSYTSNSKGSYGNTDIEIHLPECWLLIERVYYVMSQHAIISLHTRPHLNLTRSQSARQIDPTVTQTQTDIKPVIISPDNKSRRLSSRPIFQMQERDWQRKKGPARTAHLVYRFFFCLDGCCGLGEKGQPTLCWSINSNFLNGTRSGYKRELGRLT